MFEREVMIAGLRQQGELVKKLIEELEEDHKFPQGETGYYETVIKDIETALRKIRQANPSGRRFSQPSSYSILTRAW